MGRIVSSPLQLARGFCSRLILRIKSHTVPVIAFRSPWLHCALKRSNSDVNVTFFFAKLPSARVGRSDAVPTAVPGCVRLALRDSAAGLAHPSRTVILEALKLFVWGDLPATPCGGSLIARTNLIRYRVQSCCRLKPAVNRIFLKPGMSRKKAFLKGTS